jgi:hypothetical protein
MSTDLNNNAPNNKIIFLENGVRRMTTPVTQVSSKVCRTQIVLNKGSIDNSRTSDLSDGLGHSLPAVKRSPMLQTNNTKLMGQQGVPHHAISLDENGPSVDTQENNQPLDSARDYNLQYLDQVISPVSTVCRNYESSLSLSEGQNRDINEKCSTESASLHQLPSFTQDGISNPTSRNSRGGG